MSNLPAASLRRPAVPGVTWAKRDNPVSSQKVDWVDPPAEPVRPYATYVPAVDADGNEMGGVPLVLRDAPLGTYLGWNITDGRTSPPLAPRATSPAHDNSGTW